MFYIDGSGLLSCYDGDAESISLPEGVTTIGKGAFHNHANLCCITLPNSLVTIGDIVFEGCRLLRHVVFRHGIKRLGNGCFKDCVSLQSIGLPDSVASIHANAFENCSGLEEVILPRSLKRNVEKRTFAGCSSLKTVTLPQGIQQIKRDAFLGCAKLEKVVFQNAEVMIDRTAFSRCDGLDEETLTFIQTHSWMDNTVEINSRASGAAGRLSNYTERHFSFDEVECHSIEGVLQSLKCPDPEVQKEICLLTGGWAKKAGGQYNWKTDQTLYWGGKPYLRRSEEYGILLNRLYDAVFDQDASFRADLAAMKGQRIDHRMGLTNPAETVLTRNEFVRELQRLIEKTL